MTIAPFDPFVKGYYITQSYTTAEVKDKRNSITETFNDLVTDIFQTWFEKGYINCIMLNDGSKASKGPVETPRMYAPVKTEVKRKVKYTSFVKVEQTQRIGILTQVLRLKMIEVDVWIIPKFTNLEYVKKIGFLGGVNVSYANLQWYIKELSRCSNISTKEF